MNTLINDYLLTKKAMGYGDEDAKKAVMIAFGVASAQTAKELEGKELPKSWQELELALKDVNRLADFVSGPAWDDLNKVVVNNDGETIMAVFGRNLKTFLDMT